GMTRISFAAGSRARVEMSARDDVLRALGRELTCGVEGVPAALAKLRLLLAGTRDSLGRARARLADTLLAERVPAVLARGESLVILSFDDADAAFLRTVAGRITARPDLVALLAARMPEGDGTHVLAARGANSGFDC